ncbi:MAG TPA: hypothetical protein VKZ53_16955 [Candidatus Angelobacter sp.]|nr:hypothetical protein [Candidatus Angelobacter sp.]
MKRPSRLVIQYVPECDSGNGANYLLIGYGGYLGSESAYAKYGLLTTLMAAISASGAPIRLADLHVHDPTMTQILFAGTCDLDDFQLVRLGLKNRSADK